MVNCMDMPEKQPRRIKKRDFCFLAIVFAAILIFYAAVYYKEKEPGSRIEITVDNRVYGIYSLETEQEIPILIHGTETNHVRISDGFADMTEAACPDLLCVHQKKISKTGETIVCLPNRVVVEVIAGEDAGIDAVAE